jgi:hypothetical protein
MPKGKYGPYLQAAMTMTTLFNIKRRYENSDRMMGHNLGPVLQCGHSGQYCKLRVIVPDCC